MAKKTRMGNRYSDVTQLAVAKAVVDGELTATYVAEETKIHPATVSRWAAHYRQYGESGFDTLSKKQRGLINQAKKAANSK